MASEFDANSFLRLPGRARRLSSRLVSGEAQRLYASADHLLVLRRIGYEETSKRFALADIQAITVQSNADRSIVAAVLSSVMLLFASLGLIAFSQGSAPLDGVMIAVYAMIAVFGALLAFHLALGPTCTVRLHTAVQVEDLTALRRLRAARRCLAILVPRIEAVQGAWPSQIPLAQAIAGRPVSAAADVKLLRSKKAPKAIGRGLHAFAFLAAAAFGATSIADLVFERAWKDVVDTLLFGLTMLVLLIALIRQSNSTIPRPTAVLTWTLFIENALAFILVTYVGAFIVAFAAVESGDTPPMFVTGFSGFGAEEPWAFDVAVAVWGAISLVLAIFGLLSIRGYRLVARPPAGAPGSGPP